MLNKWKCETTEGYVRIIFFIALPPKERDEAMNMEMYTIHYKNKIHYFHTWGAAVLV